MALPSIRSMSLCSGGGGLDLALHLIGAPHRVVVWVERDSYAAGTLVARMEGGDLVEAPIWDDLSTFDGSPWRGAVDLVTAGYPCQPFSVAGRKQAQDDPRHIWPHVARVITECVPKLVFLENVSNHLNLGFDEVCRDLQGLGYTVAATLLQAADVGAPHKRERLFALAVPDYGRDLLRQLAERIEQHATLGGHTQPEDLGRKTMADDDGAGCEAIWEPSEGPKHYGTQGRYLDRCGEALWPPTRFDDAGWVRYLARWADRSPAFEPGFRRGSHGLAVWMERCRLLGNGVVPLQAAVAFGILAIDLAGHVGLE